MYFDRNQNRTEHSEQIYRYIYTPYIYITYIIIFFKSFLNNLRNVLLFVLLFESLSTVNYQNSYSSSCHTIITIIYTPQTHTHRPYTPPQSHITPTTTHTHTHKHTYKLTRSNENAKDFFNWFKKRKKEKIKLPSDSDALLSVIGNRDQLHLTTYSEEERKEERKKTHTCFSFSFFYFI